MTPSWLHFLHGYFAALVLVTTGSFIYLIRLIWPGE
jgi:hypothetical protein